MLVWLIKEGEPLPCDGDNVRMFRIGILAENLVRAGHKVVWWSSTYNHAEKKFRYAEARHINIIENYDLKLIHACSYYKNISLRRIIHQHKTANAFEVQARNSEKPDIILVCMPTIDLLVKAVQYGMKNSIPVVADIRDLWPDIYEDYFPSSLKPIIRIISAGSKRKLSWALENTAGIVSLTKPYLDWGLKYAGKKTGEHTKVFPLAYKDSNKPISDSELEFWYKKGINQGDFICCFYGQIGHAADIETIIEAAKLCKDNHIKFVIAGTGEKLDSLKQKALNYDNTIFPGWINAESIRAISYISSVGLMPYRPSKNYEMNMPNKFAEYLSFGLPIMVQPKGIMTEAVIEHNCGLHYENEKMLLDNLLMLKNDRELLKLMSRNARSFYENSFKAETVYGSFVDYLQKIYAISTQRFKLEGW